MLCISFLPLRPFRDIAESGPARGRRGMSDRLVFSTDALPERDRFAIWREEILSRYPHCQITTQDQAGFRARIELQRIGSIDISRLSTTAAEFTRTRDLLRDGDDTLMVALVERGTTHSKQREEYQTFVGGDAFILDSAYCNSQFVSSDLRSWILKIPRQKIAALLPRLTGFCAARLDVTAPRGVSFFIISTDRWSRI